MLKDLRVLIESDKPADLWYFDAEAYLRLAEFHREYKRFILNRKYIGKASEVVGKNGKRPGERELVEKLRHKIIMRKIRASIASDSAKVGLAQIERAIKKTHNIAAAINRSVSTVKYTKSSLKKKLATDISLEEYLRGISAMDDAELARRANIKT